MKKNGDRKLKLQRVSGIILALFVALILSSCSPAPEGMVLCNFSIQSSTSRTISATIDPISGYEIYYKTIYKGSGECYGGMKESDDYKKLEGNGILVSQGLWEVKVEFRKEGFDSLYASSGDIYINLNTTSIEVKFSQDKGYVSVGSYSLSSFPSAYTTPSIEVSIFKNDGSTNTKVTTFSLTNKNPFLQTGGENPRFE